MARHRLAAALVAGVVLSASGLAHGGGVASVPQKRDYVYTVKRGDTLIALAKAYLTGPAAIAMVERINHVALARRLPIGKHLLLPRALLRDAATEASLASFAGDVAVVAGGHRVGASLNAKLAEGDEIETGRNAFAAVKLADGTLLSLPSDTRVKLARLRRVIIDGAIERTVQLESGRVRAAVVPMHDPHSGFEVTTPLSVSAVRGTHFGVAYGENASATSVEEGGVGLDAAVGAAGKPAPSLDVPAGFGVATTPAGNTGVLALLPSPSLNDPGRVQTGDDMHFVLGQVAGASAYRVAVAKDAGALNVLAEASGAQGDFTLPPVPAGSYFLRVSAVDGHGIEGMSDAYAFERRHNVVSGGGAGDARKFRFDWQATADGKPVFHFKLIRKPAAGGAAMAIADEAGLTQPGLTVTNLPPGEYLWQVSSTIVSNGRAIEEWTPPQAIHVFAAH